MPPVGIRTHNPNKPGVAVPRLRPRGHWDRLSSVWNCKFRNTCKSEVWCCSCYGVPQVVHVMGCRRLCHVMGCRRFSRYGVPQGFHVMGCRRFVLCSAADSCYGVPQVRVWGCRRLFTFTNSLVECDRNVGVIKLVKTEPVSDSIH